jgi:hypothetical protein
MMEDGDSEIEEVWAAVDVTPFFEDEAGVLLLAPNPLAQQMRQINEAITMRRYPTRGLLLVSVVGLPSGA